MRVCFIGHRKVEDKENLLLLLNDTVVSLLKNGATTFLFGSKSEFDDLCWQVVTKLKKEFSYIKRIYVRSAFQVIDKDYEDYLLKSYEQTYFPPKIEKAGKFSYVERNYEMIDNSTYCVFYYNQNYSPQPVKNLKKNKILSVKRNSGTKIAYEYAVKRKKQIINLYKSKLP